MSTVRNKNIKYCDDKLYCAVRANVKNTIETYKCYRGNCIIMLDCDTGFLWVDIYKRTYENRHVYSLEWIMQCVFDSNIIVMDVDSITDFIFHVVLDK